MAGGPLCGEEWLRPHHTPEPIAAQIAEDETILTHRALRRARHQGLVLVPRHDPAAAWPGMATVCIEIVVASDAFALQNRPLMLAMKLAFRSVCAFASAPIISVFT